MKKTILILASIFLTGIGFYGCKKGENDPMISLHSRKGRLCGEWNISKGSGTTNFAGNVYTENWTENSVTFTSSGGSVVGTNAKYILTIEKDGTYRSEKGWMETIATVSTIYNFIETGLWNWQGRVGDAKNKSSVIFRTIQSTDTQGSSVTISSYTGDDAPSTVMAIDQLKNKELIVIWNGTSTSGSSTSSNQGEMTFTKAK